LATAKVDLARARTPEGAAPRIAAQGGPGLHHQSHAPTTSSIRMSASWSTSPISLAAGVRASHAEPLRARSQASPWA